MASLRSDKDGNAIVDGDLLLKSGKTVKVNGVDALGGGTSASGVELLATIDVVVAASTDGQDPQDFYTVPNGKMCIYDKMVFSDAVCASVLDFVYTAVGFGGTHDLSPDNPEVILVPGKIRVFRNDACDAGAAGETLQFQLTNQTGDPGTFKARLFGTLVDA